MNNKRKRNNNVFLNMNAAEAYFYTKFGESVEEKRKDRGLKQTDVYQKTGINAPYLSKIENGKVRVNFFDAILLQKFLNFDFSKAVEVDFSNDQQIEFTDNTNLMIINKSKLKLISFIIEHLDDSLCEKLYQFLKESIDGKDD